MARTIQTLELFGLRMPPNKSPHRTRLERLSFKRRLLWAGSVSFFR